MGILSFAGTIIEKTSLLLIVIISDSSVSELDNPCRENEQTVNFETFLPFYFKGLYWLIYFEHPSNIPCSSAYSMV